MNEIKVIEFKGTQELFIELNNYENEGIWVYRGQRNFCWKLKSSIERMFEEWNSFRDVEKERAEISLIKKFQREAHHFKITGYDFLNIPEWLSLMQNYGAPTRLVDWSHSMWVSLFFSIIDTTEEDKNAALFVLNWDNLDKKTNENIKKLFRKDNNLMSIDSFAKAAKRRKGVIHLNSYKQNIRQAIQQGTFLFPLDLNCGFEENLLSTLSSDDIYKIKIPFSWKKEIVQKLFRMNITYASLYPGIEGYSKSLKHLFYIKGLLHPEEGITNYDDFKKKFTNAK